MATAEIYSLSKKYSDGNTDLVILDKCNYVFQTGVFYAIVGRSGLGKTTLLRILGTVEKPDKGNLVINNHNLKYMSEEQLAALRCNQIGFIFQNYCLIDRYSVSENLEIPIFFSGVRSKAQIQKMIRDAISKVDLDERVLEQRVSVLSGGEKQRVSIARALINDPAIIFADEPTGNLDIENEAKVIEIFKRLNTEMGKTIVMVTHNLDIAKQADKVITLQNGRIVAARIE